MISVCLATYNGEKYIREQLDSVLLQLGKEDEVIVSDDGSTDSTLKIVEHIADKRIRILHHRKTEVSSRSACHMYTSANFGYALSHAQGEYIFMSDHDDIWSEGRVSRMISELSKGNVLTMCNFSIIDAGGHMEMKRYFKSSPISGNMFLNLVRMPFYGCCMAFRYELLRYILPFPQGLVLHDNWIGFIALSKGSVGFIDEPLHLYRRHETNVSEATAKSKNPLVYKISYRVQFYRQLKKILGGKCEK